MTITVTNPTNGKKFDALFLVDTGSDHSMIPAPLLDSIEVTRRGKRVYELADGSIRQYDFGFVEIEFLGDIAQARVIFGDPESEPLLGAIMLEDLGIVVDPLSKKLFRQPAFPLKAALGIVTI